ncbi:unnamed protein product, partial [Lymnaea stagnalis]
GELGDQLRYYETLDHLDIKVRRKRSTDSNGFDEKYVSFSAFNREFNLVLKPGTKVLTADFSAKLVYSDGRSAPLNVNPNDFFSGHITGDKSVKADAYTEDGVWGANIYDENDTITLEPAWRHLPSPNNHTMIVYRHSDVKWDNIFPNLNTSLNHTVKVCGTRHPEDDPDYTPYSEEDIKQMEEMFNKKKSSTRHKRDGLTLDTCHVIAVADYTFFNGPGGGFPHRTANYVVQTMQKVDTIFRKTVWNQELQLTGLGFQIKELRIHPEPTVTNQSHYNMKMDNWPDSNLLRQFGQDKDFHNFCLAHLFTHRKFAGGVLGLAYIASARKFANGGICSLIRNNPIAYNTGFSSTMNTKGNNLLSQEAVLVTTHGHNWGSEHDAETSECAPNSFNKGRYIMYPYAVSGYEENNHVFSPCSKRYVSAVIMARSGSCFKGKKYTWYTANVPMCGNGIVDKNEDCDSGGLGLSGQDPCCSATCKLNPGSVCSSTNYECCQNCNLAPRGTVCRGKSKELCQEEAECSGYSLDCPGSKPIADETATVCMDEGLCKGGKCLGYCERHKPNSRPCRCTDTGKECFRCCRPENGTCESVSDDFLADGRPCSFGYCDKGRCQRGKANMIQRLFSFIEQLDSSTVVAFMKSNIVGTIVVFSLIIWVPVSWIVSCIDKRREKKSKKFQEHMWSNVLSHKLKNYTIRDSTQRH